MPDEPQIIPAENETPPPPPVETPPAAGDAPKTYDEKTVKELRSEAAKYRTELRDAQAKIDAHEKATLSESEKKDRELEQLRKDNESLKTSRQRALLDADIATHSAALGIKADLAGRLIRPDEVTYDEQGAPSNVRTVLDDLVKAHPYLKAASGTQYPEQTPDGKPAKRDVLADYLNQTYPLPKA